jgi:hypothetical protein
MKLELDILKSLLEGPHFDHRKKNLYAKCPKCGFSEFGISIDDNHWFGCFRKSQCGFKGNIIGFLKYIGREDLLQEEVIRLGEKLDIDIDKKDGGEESYELSLPTINAPIGFRRVTSNKYLEERGFSSFDKYKVGMTTLDKAYRDRVIFIIEEDGEVKGFLGRGISDDIKPKYKNSSSDFAKLLGGVEEIEEDTHTLVLVEGILDKENLDKLMKFDEQSEIKCCFTFGAKVSIYQIIKMKMFNIKHIVLFYEGDVIGIIQKYAFELEKEFEKVSIVLPPEGKDPGSINVEEAEGSLFNKYSPMHFYRKKVNIIKLK